MWFFISSFLIFLVSANVSLNHLKKTDSAWYDNIGGHVPIFFTLHSKTPECLGYFLIAGYSRYWDVYSIRARCFSVLATCSLWFMWISVLYQLIRMI
jgi:hypothetical protein